jgi:hypothetical protein
MDNNLNNIKKMYDKLSYFDQYGGSLILFIIVTITIISLISYFHVMINVQPIIDDWPNQRCKPNIMPIAGFITHSEGVSATEYTAKNFTYCVQNILSNITGDIVMPLTYLTDFLKSVADGIQEFIQSIRAMFNKIRTYFQTVSEEIMGRLMNIMTPLIQIIISFRDLVGKIQGTMTAALFTLLGGYYTLQSLMGAIAQLIIIILIALAVLIGVFWIFPFTWGFAIANTVIFLAIAIPMAIILAFMVDVLKVNPNLSIPSVKCFDKNTLIQMDDGTNKKISCIEVGDVLINKNMVTARMKVATRGSTMYILNNIIVSDSHIIKYNDNWIPVSKHPKAIKLDSYNEEFLYCLNTSNKVIETNNLIFTDWDEIYDDKLYKILRNTPNNDIQFIHKYLDYGFDGSTKIPVQNINITSKLVDIDKIKIDDILENGEKVYGIVEIYGSDINEQFKYNLGENTFVEGFIPFFNNNKKEIITNKSKKLYHLLTNKGTFKLENILFKDYNAAIDRFL